MEKTEKAIADLGLTAGQLEEMREAFALFDKDGDGSITASELLAVMHGLGQKVTENEVKEMLRGADLDLSGKIEFYEFLKMMAEKSKSINKEELMLEAFKVFDIDKDGLISPSELQKVLKQLGENLTKAEIRYMMKEADIDKNGLIDYHEFVKLMSEKRQ